MASSAFTAPNSEAHNTSSAPPTDNLHIASAPHSTAAVPLSGSEAMTQSSEPVMHNRATNQVSGTSRMCKSQSIRLVFLSFLSYVLPSHLFNLSSYFK